MVLHKNGKQLYDNVRQEVSEHLNHLAQDKIVPLFPKESDAAEKVAFLKAVKETWEHHTLCMGMIRDILMYMVCFAYATEDKNVGANLAQQDKVYVKTANPPVPEVFNLGMDLFRDFILRDSAISPRIISAMLELIKLERDGDTIDKMVLTGVSTMMAKLEMPIESDFPGSTVYEVDFEGVFLAKSTEYYSLESEHYLAQNDVIQYLKKVSELPALRRRHSS